MKKFFGISLIVFLMMAGSIEGTEVYLTDIQTHWAKENIIRMVINEKANGYPDNTFQPDKEITVLEFIKLICDNLKIDLVKGGFNKWPDYYIATAEKYQLNDNYGKLLTRNEAIEMISQLIDLKNISTSSKKFKDVSGKEQSIISKLYRLNVIKGYEDDTFRGKNHLTRAEAVSIILRVVDANQKIMKTKKYEICSEYSNYISGEKQENLIRKPVFYRKDNKIFFIDNGRFSNIKDYEIEEKYITNKKLIKILQTLVTEKSYTALYYVPSEYIINQIIVKYGESENAVQQNLEYFGFTYFEDKMYDLNRVTLNTTFSNECYLKINIKKMWTERYQYENNQYVDDNVKDKLLQVLKIEFGKDAEEILTYLLEQYEMSITINEPIAKQTEIGNHIINTYQTDATSLEFYFEKLSS